MIALSSRKLTLALALIAVVIIGVHLATLIAAYGLGHDYLFGITDLFDVDGERNVPTAFAFCLLLIAALLLAVIAVWHGPGRTPRKTLWVGLAVIFVFLAADEGLAIHERIGQAVAERLGIDELTYYAWLLPYGAAGLILLPFLVRFIRQLQSDTRIQFMIAGAVYVAGAFVTEFIGGIYVHYFHTEHALGYDLLSALEESLEMVGMILFIRALMHYLEIQRHDAASPERIA